MSKVKVLGKKYGIEITRPWNNKMYNHNDEVAEVMKWRIMDALTEALQSNDDVKMNVIQKYICAYGMCAGHTIEEVHEEACEGLDRVQNFWLNTEWPEMVKDGLVKDVEQGFVGYDKTI
jgi:hypothetical protein